MRLLIGTIRNREQATGKLDLSRVMLGGDWYLRDNTMSSFMAMQVSGCINPSAGFRHVECGQRRRKSGKGGWKGYDGDGALDGFG